MRGRAGIWRALAAVLLAVTALSACLPWDRSDPTPTPVPATAAPAPTPTSGQSSGSGTVTPVATPSPRPTAIVVTREPAKALPTVPPGVLGTGDAKLGQELFVAKGCISCHKVRGEGGDTGPALDGIGNRARRPMLAGSLQNTPENKWLWITNPQLVKPGSAMSPQPLSPEEAAHLVAFLETLK